MSDDLAKQLRTDAEAYRQSLAAPTSHDMFTLAYQWQDKKHRHVWDLCDRLETAADRIEKLQAANLQQSIITVDHLSRIEKLEAALRSVAQNNYGLQSMMEDGTDTPEARAEYYAGQVIRRQNIARKALEGKDD